MVTPPGNQKSAMILRPVSQLITTAALATCPLSIQLNVTLSMRFYIHIPPYPRRRRLMMTVIPAMRVVMIVIVIMSLVTARESKHYNEREKPDADDVLYFVFHLEGV